MAAPSPLSIHSVIVVSHIELVTDGTLLVLLVHAFLLRLAAPHVLPVGAVRVDVLVRLLVDVASPIGSTIGGIGSGSRDR